MCEFDITLLVQQCQVIAHTLRVVLDLVDLRQMVNFLLIEWRIKMDRNWLANAQTVLYACLDEFN